MIRFIVIVFLSGSNCAFSQIVNQDLQEVQVYDSLNPWKIITTDDKNPVLKRKEILELQAEDAGQLLQKIAGVNIKSYGGLGGLKTISFRGLGGQHTQLVIDGFTNVQDQSGQVNLGLLHTDNIDKISIMNDAGAQLMTPASSLCSGNSVIIESFEHRFGNHPHELRVTQKAGSFEQYDSYLAYKFSTRKFFLSALGKFRTSKGDYNYSMINGNTTFEGIRTNNQYMDLNTGTSMGIKFSQKSEFTIGYRNLYIDQELPGAVILYNTIYGQTLSQNNHRIYSDFKHKGKFLQMRVFGSLNSSGMTYKDPSYLNEEGELRSEYKNENATAGINLTSTINQNWIVNLCSEEQISQLKSNVTGEGRALRYHNFAVLRIKRFFPAFNVNAQLSQQFVTDLKEDTKHALYKLNPFIQLESRPLGKRNKILLSAIYKNSFRMPSFNELYYNNIGNSLLIPERADQFGLSSDYFYSHKSVKGVTKCNVYYNLIKDKIVAVPSKNLFIWSMQNVGLVQIIGFDISNEFTLKTSKLSALTLSVNYTFQHALDKSDSESPTYNNQIAYIPVHSGNSDLGFNFKKYGIRFSNYVNSVRYSLNENIKANEVPAFIVSDLGVYFKFDHRLHHFRIQLSCKNVFNSSYAIIRNYVMPGRNYLISLNYEIH